MAPGQQRLACLGPSHDVLVVKGGDLRPATADRAMSRAVATAGEELVVQLAQCVKVAADARVRRRRRYRASP